MAVLAVVTPVAALTALTALAALTAFAPFAALPALAFRVVAVGDTPGDVGHTSTLGPEADRVKKLTK